MRKITFEGSAFQDLPNGQLQTRKYISGYWL